MLVFNFFNADVIFEGEESFFIRFNHSRRRYNIAIRNLEKHRNNRQLIYSLIGAGFE